MFAMILLEAAVLCMVMRKEQTPYSIGALVLTLLALISTVFRWSPF